MYDRVLVGDSVRVEFDVLDDTRGIRIRVPLWVVDEQAVKIFHHVVILVYWFVLLRVEAVALDFPEGAMNGGTEADATWLLEDTL